MSGRADGRRARTSSDSRSLSNLDVVKVKPGSATYRQVCAGLAIVSQAQLSRAKCELVSPKDDHVTPTDVRDAMTRKANPVIYGGVVCGTWAR